MHTRAVVALGVLIGCRDATALNPSLDISQYAHKSWTVRDGLFKGAIYSIAQTPDGYLWLATEFGLVHFDGVQEVAWRPPKDENLPDNWVVRLLVSRDGRLWIGTYKGLASWKDGRLTRYPELDGLFVQSLLEDREGTIWAGTGRIPTGRLCAIQNGRVTCSGENGGLGSGVLALYEDPAGGLWAGAATGLWRWRPGPPKFYPAPDAQSQITSLLKGENGELWIAMSGGMRQLMGDKFEPVPGNGVVSQPQAMMRDRDGGLWIATDHGLLRMHHGRTVGFTQSDGLSGDIVNALYEDREHNVWVATGSGLDRFRQFAIPTISIKEGLSNASVTSVLPAQDHSVWIGTNDGLNRWKDGRVAIYRQQGDPTSGDREIKGSGLQSRGLHAISQDRSGRIWISTRRGLAYFENDRFIPVSGLPAGGNGFSITGDTAGNLWMSHDRGLFRLPREGAMEVTPWATLGRDYAAVSLLADADRGLWLGFRDGLTYWKDGQVRASYGPADGVGRGLVRGLQLDPDGALWAATEGGLSRVKDGRVATLTSKNGLPCDTVHWAMEDDAHSFWLYTACGLIRIPRTSLDAWAANPSRQVEGLVFDTSDGVRIRAVANGYNPRVSKSADGKIWFLNPGGVSVIDPHALAFNPIPPPVDIEQITADRKTYDASSNLRLPPLVRDLEIDYTALSLVAPEKNRFRVKLEGRDATWKDVGGERKAFYSDLPPRNYRFRVAASNNNGVWNEAGASFDFSIAPAYYQTRWFQASCAAAFLGLLWALYRYRLHQVAQEFSARLDERVNERTRIARELHDTLLQSFQGLMLRFQVAHDELPARPAEARKTLEYALDQAAQAIAEGRDAVQGLRSSPIETNDLALALGSLGEELAGDERNANRVESFVEVEGTPRDIHPILRDEIYRIAGEALRNAFRHAQARRIEVVITYGEPHFRLRVRDNGTGIDPEVLDQQGRAGHWGLVGMRERAELIGGELEIRSQRESGTQVELSIPASIAYAASPALRFRLLARKGGTNA